MRNVVASLFVLALTLGSAACTSAPRPVVESASPRKTATIAVVDATDPAGIRAQLAAHRKQEIERLAAYAQDGVFPHNTTSAAPVHMFKDADGRRCAVANLVYLDGHEDVVDAYAERQNDVTVADVTSGPLQDWMLTSGFTREEIARIQEPAPMMTETEPGEELQRAQMQSYFTTVEAALVDGTDRSLDVAVQRYEATAGKANVAAK